VRSALIFSLAAVLGLSACSRNQIIHPTKAPLSFVIMPNREASMESMDTIEGMLTDSGFTAVDRALLPAIFDGLEVPPSGPLEPALAAEINHRSRAGMLIVLNWRKNTGDQVYEDGAYSLQMRWLRLPGGKIVVSRAKTLYFKPSKPDVKELMKACLDAYRAAQ
jgi:hypothetical protein